MPIYYITNIFLIQHFKNYFVVLKSESAVFEEKAVIY